MEDKKAVAAVSTLSYHAEQFGELVWSGVEGYDQQDYPTIRKAWDKEFWTLAGQSLINELNTREEIFIEGLNLLINMEFLDSKNFHEITDKFNSLMDYALEKESIEKWRNDLEKTMLKLLCDEKPKQASSTPVYDDEEV